MKSIHISIWLLILSSFAISCSKSGSSTGGGSTSGTDSLSVSGVLPAQPYVDDIITINGKNFNPDPTKDTVYFGMLPGTTGANGQPAIAVRVKYEVISATATQLKVKLPAATPSLDPLQSANSTMNNPAELTKEKGFIIYANGKQKVMSVPFKLLPAFSASRYTPNTITQGNFQANYAGCIYGSFGAPYLFLYEGDSLLLDGRGLNNVTVTLNGKALGGLVVKDNPTTQSQHAAAYVPYGFFAEPEPVGVPDRCPIIGTRVLNIKVTNSDGKSTTFTQATYYPAPNSGIYSYGLNTNTFSQSNINSQPLFKIVGYALRSTMTIRVTCIRNGSAIYNQTFPCPGGYPNEVTFAVDLKALPTPTTAGDQYSITLNHEATGPVIKGAGGSGFSLTP